MSAGALERPSDQRLPIGILAGALVVLVACYLNTLAVASRMWEDPKYSHGYLVPLFTLVLLYLRFKPFEAVGGRARWAGVGLLTLAVAARAVGARYMHMTLEYYSFVVAVAAVFLLIGGWKALAWAGPAVAFLIFMFPLPRPLDAGLSLPMQHMATRASTYILQTVGLPAYNEGNVIMFGSVQMGVVDQCSGLRMLTLFVAMSFAIILVTERPLWERLVVVVSSIPIALAVNVLRITITGIVFWMASKGYLIPEDWKEWVEHKAHDWAGYFMMPAALLALYVEMRILAKVWIVDDHSGPFMAKVNPTRSEQRQPVSTPSG